MTPSNHITPYAKAKECERFTPGQALSQGESNQAHVVLLQSTGLAPMEEGARPVAFCPKCCTIHSNPIQIEAIEDWGECLGCDKLNLLDFDPEI